MPQRAKASIIEHFGVVEDPRIERHKQHKLLDIIVIAICAVICGAEGWVAVAEVWEGQGVAMDGKTLRRSYDRGSDKAAIHMIRAWASKNRVVLGQLKTEEKSNEITAIPELL